MSATTAEGGNALSDLPLALLGSFEFEATTPRFADRWRRVMARVEDERPLYDYCTRRPESCPAALRDWRAHVARAKGLPPFEQIRHLNRAVNAAVDYASDREAHGEADFWASPVEFLQAGGDCEDFAILKYVSLRELGFADDRLRIVVVRDRPSGRLHAVLVVELEGRAYVLDNKIAEPIQHQHMLRYRPVYSANASGQWIHLVTGEVRRRFVAELARQPAPHPKQRPNAGARRAVPPQSGAVFGSAPSADLDRL